MYELRTPNSVKKDVKRLDKAVQRALRDEHFPKIKANPHAAKPLRRDLKGLWTYHFSFGPVQYRIAYRILEEEKVVALVMAGSREGFYEAVRRRLGLW